MVIVTSNLGGLRVQLQRWLSLRWLHVQLGAHVGHITPRAYCTWDSGQEEVLLAMQAVTAAAAKALCIFSIFIFIFSG